MAKYGHCKETAATVSGNTPGSTVAYGLYLPDTEEETWHPHWQDRNFTSPVPVFTHFWVEKDDEIIDHAAEQFGGPQVVKVPKDDSRYVKIGTYYPDEERVEPEVNDPKIKWDTHSEKLAAMEVVWDGMYNHLRYR